jgi:hypothetical protein
MDLRVETELDNTACSLPLRRPCQCIRSFLDSEMRTCTQIDPPTLCTGRRGMTLKKSEWCHALVASCGVTAVAD